MTQLVEALHALHLEGEVALGDRWVKLKGEHCWVYVTAATRSGGYFTWCDDPEGRAVEFYFDPIEAIQAGLRRATRADRQAFDVE